MEGSRPEQITPEHALMILANNPRNRSLSKHIVDKYASLMAAGKWAVNGETIVIASDGALNQGQHRLHACVQAGVPFTTYVVRGVAPEVFDTYDQGRPRSVSDVLHLSGEVSVQRLAAAARAACWVQHGARAASVMWSGVRCKEILIRFPNLRYWIARLNNGGGTKLFPSALAGVMAVASEHYGQDTMDKFFTGLETGLGLSPTDPAYVLREKFITRARGQTFLMHVQLAYMIKAAKAYGLGKPMSILRFAADEAFPEF